MFSALPCIRLAAALASVAIVASACTAANNATSSQASNQGEQSYKTMYGLSSEGTTTDLYTELFGGRQAPPAPQSAVATAQPAQPVSTQTVNAQPVTPPQPAPTSTHTARIGQGATAAKGAPQPISPPPPPVVAAQQPPAPPAPPPEPDVPTAYGITANGPTTDLYTMIFGPRRSDRQ